MAINTHRAERKTQRYLGPHERTPNGVSPGTYSNTHQEPFKVEGEKPVPFQSGADKVLCPNLSASGYTPGPGAYVGQPGAVHNASGEAAAQLKSKVTRIGPTSPGSTVFTASTIEKNPGPGTYSGNKGDWELALKKPPRNAANPWREAVDKTVPSIPPQKLPPDAQPENSMGADISNLTMRHTGERTDTAGPGEYDPKISLITPSAPQSSFDLGGPRKDRSLWEPSGHIENTLPPKQNPGPGAYDCKKSMAEDPAADNGKGETFQFASKTVLHHQRKEPEERVMPGPGQYDRRGDIEKSATKAKTHSDTHGERTRFGSAVQRIGWSRSVDQPYVDPYNIHHVPGPGSYPTQGGIFAAPGKDLEKEAQKAVPGHKKKKFHGVHHPMIVMALQETQGPLEAFGSTDDRNCNKVQLQSTPAPWAYNKAEARGSSMAAELREKKKIGRNGAFGTLADRFFGSPLEGRDGLPDPGMDDGAGERHTTGSNNEPRSMFLSQTPRMQSSAGPKEVHASRVGHIETPAPDAYNVCREANYRSPFRTPRTDHLSFGSGQKRFDLGRDIFDGHTAPGANPAPGEYNAKQPASRRNGAAEVKDKRKLAQPVGATNADVGPGSYGAIDTVMLKKTFNVSTQAPVAFKGSTPRRPRPVGSESFSGM